MNLEHARRLATPEEIAVRAPEQAPFLRLPDARHAFAERERRLRSLAAGHPMAEYLQFIAEVASAQHQGLAEPMPVGVPDAAAMRSAAERRGPPLPVVGWVREAGWLTGLRRMLGQLEQRLPQSDARQQVRHLAGRSDAYCETQAERLLGAVMTGLDLAAAPLIAAALQMYWTRLVGATVEAHGLSAFARTAAATLCPCCGCRPTASVVRIGGEEGGYRYLHCALCAAQWHMVRIKCAHCESTRGIHYLSLDAESASEPAARSRSAAVKAECCDVCGHYLKIFSMEVSPDIEPVADDLASIALDLLVSEAGKTPAGLNPMLLYGDPGDG